jgi:non-ribosomal peptide synthetase component F
VDLAEEPLHLSLGLLGRLNRLSHRCAATQFMILLTGFKALLLARTGRNDVCVAITVANRSDPRTERLIGPVANTVLICTRLDADLSFDEALGRVRSAVIEAVANQETPFDIVADRLADDYGLDPASLVQVMFVLQNLVGKQLNLTGTDVQPFSTGESQPIISVDRTALTVTLAETESGLEGTCRYKGDLFEPTTIQGWLSSYMIILGKAAANPELSLGRLTDLQP